MRDAVGLERAARETPKWSTRMRETYAKARQCIDLTPLLLEIEDRLLEAAADGRESILISRSWFPPNVTMDHLRKAMQVKHPDMNFTSTYSPETGAGMLFCDPR